jgi:biopolymer transport protein ExbD
VAFSPIGAPAGRRSRGLPPMAEINVTPFVDVALVLLIIFMITAHVMEYGVDVDVPKTKSVATSTKELPIVTISKASEIYLGKDPVNIHRLVQEIRTRYPGQDAVYLRADGAGVVDPFVNVMSVLADGKLAVKIMTQTDDKIGKKR